MRSPKTFSPPRSSTSPSGLRVELLDEARSAGADPREYAAARLVNLVVKLNDKEPLDGKAEDRRVELATAAALVYVGRIGYV